jgi:hypothetical protein
MRQPTLSVTASLAAVFLASLAAAPAARAQNPPYTVEVTASRIWTNDDMDRLRAQGMITTFSESAATAPQGTARAPATETAVAPAPRPVRVQDPDWYAEQAELLQAELAQREDALQEYLANLANAKHPDQTTGGIALDRPSIGVTPEAGAQILAEQVDEIQAQLEDLAELARVNGIPPGALRG